MNTFVFRAEPATDLSCGKALEVEAWSWYKWNLDFTRWQFYFSTRYLSVLGGQYISIHLYSQGSLPGRPGYYQVLVGLGISYGPLHTICTPTVLYFTGPCSSCSSTSAQVLVLAKQEEVGGTGISWKVRVRLHSARKSDFRSFRRQNYCRPQATRRQHTYQVPVAHYCTIVAMAYRMILRRP